MWNIICPHCNGTLPLPDQWGNQVCFYCARQYSQSTSENTLPELTTDSQQFAVPVAEWGVEWGLVNKLTGSQRNEENRNTTALGLVKRWLTSVACFHGRHQWSGCQCVYCQYVSLDASRHTWNDGREMCISCGARLLMCQKCGGSGHYVDVFGLHGKCGASRECTCAGGKLVQPIHLAMESLSTARCWSTEIDVAARSLEKS